MAIEVDKRYVISDPETGEKISLSVLGNGNFMLKIETSDGELKPDIFEELIRVGRELIN